MYQLRKMLASTLLVAGLGLAATLPAHAGVTFTTGNHPQPDEKNILLNSGGTGNPVFGTTNMSSITVAFSSSTDTLTEPSSGQARVGAMDGLVNDVSISIPGGDYTDLIINPFGIEDPPANVSVFTDLGNTYNFMYDLGVGNNFLTIVADGGEKILSTDINSAAGFDDLRQPRISGTEIGTPSATPEPCSLALLGMGALPLAARLRRRRQA
jgi:hypothetical protein